MRLPAIVLMGFFGACAGGRWESVQAQHPATPGELAACHVTVVGPQALAEAMAARGFTVVAHSAFRADLELRIEGGIATLSSEGYFVDEVAGDDPQEIAARLARSERVAEFVRNSGTVEQHASPGM
jgi:hypothetical protein